MRYYSKTTTCAAHLSSERSVFHTVGICVSSSLVIIDWSAIVYHFLKYHALYVHGARSLSYRGRIYVQTIRPKSLASRPTRRKNDTFLFKLIFYFGIILIVEGVPFFYTCFSIETSDPRATSAQISGFAGRGWAFPNNGFDRILRLFSCAYRLVVVVHDPDAVDGFRVRPKDKVT